MSTRLFQIISLISSAGILAFLLMHDKCIRDILYKSKLVANIEDFEQMKNRLSEEKTKYQRVFEVVKECVFIINKNNEIMECNDAVYDIFEWKKEDIIGKNINVIFTKNLTINENTIVECKTKTGKEVVVDVSAVSTEFELDTIICAVCRNVTEQRDAYRKIRILNETLSSRVEALQLFQYTLFHDVNSPLHTINGFSEIILEDYKDRLPKDAIEYLNTIVSSTKYLTRLVNDIMRFSEMSDGKMGVIREEFSLSEMAKEICQKYITEDKKTEIIIEPNMICNSDKALTHMLLTNLISNAFNFSSKKDIIKIKIARIKTDDKIMYYILDNGIGFDKEKYNLLFRPFSRLHDKKDYKGTGIGLAIVKQIVKLHGGDCSADSSPNNGAIFYFNLGEKNG